MFLFLKIEMEERAGIIFNMEYYEAWYKTFCPKCDTANWHNNGFEEDLSQMDVESIECWNCHHFYWLDEPDEIMIQTFGFTTPEDANCELGKKSPE
jgi:hypothetical protein